MRKENQSSNESTGQKVVYTSHKSGAKLLRTCPGCQSAEQLPAEILEKILIRTPFGDPLTVHIDELRENGFDLTHSLPLSLACFDKHYGMQELNALESLREYRASLTQDACFPIKIVYAEAQHTAAQRNKQLAIDYQI